MARQVLGEAACRRLGKVVRAEVVWGSARGGSHWQLVTTADHRHAIVYVGGGEHAGTVDWHDADDHTTMCDTLFPGYRSDRARSRAPLDREALAAARARQVAGAKAEAAEIAGRPPRPPTAPAPAPDKQAERDRNFALRGLTVW